MKICNKGQGVIESVRIENMKLEVDSMVNSLEVCRKKVHGKRKSLISVSADKLKGESLQSFVEKRDFCLQRIDQLLNMIDASILELNVADFNIDRWKTEKDMAKKSGIERLINNDLTDIISAQLHFGETLATVNDLMDLIMIIADLSQ